MKRVVVRYRTRPTGPTRTRRSPNELTDGGPGGVRYATFRLEDGVTSVHVAEVDGDTNPLPALAAFQECQRELGDRVDAPPAARDATLAGAYRVSGA